MTNLLTHAEYSAIAEALDPPRSPFIDGKYQRGNGPMMATTNPASGAEIAQISTADTTDVDLAVTNCLLYTSPSPRDVEESRMPSSA